MVKHPLNAITERAVASAPLRMDSFDARFHDNMWCAFQDEQTLLHFIRREYFKSLLENSSLRFKRLDLYSDCYEGRFPAIKQTQEATVCANLTRDLNIKRDAQALVSGQEILRTYTFIHCWFGHDSESRPLWDRYGDGGLGVCIRSSTARIRRSVHAPGPHLHVQPGKVTYSEETTPIGTLFSLAPAFRKHPDFRDESEYRLVGVIPPDFLPTDAEGYLASAPEFQLVPVLLSDLIEEILIGPNCGVDQIEEVFELAQKFVPNVHVNGSRFWRP